MLATPDLPPMSAMYKEPPLIALRAPSSYAAITPELKLITLPLSGFSLLLDAAREHLAARAIQDLERYARFRSGWDGYSGRPFQVELIRKAIEIIGVANFFFKISGVTIDAIIPGPASDGSVDIEFRRNSKTLIVTMYPDAETAQVYRDDGDQSTDETVRIEPMALVPHLAWLAG